MTAIPTNDIDLTVLTQRQLSLEEDTAEEAARTYKDKLLMAHVKGKDMTVFSPERYLLGHSVEVTPKAIHTWLMLIGWRNVGEVSCARCL